MRYILSFVLLSWIVLVPPSECANNRAVTTESQTVQAVKYVEQGDILFGQGSFDQAIKAYSTAIELNNKLEAAYWGRGRIYHFDKDSYPSAVDDYSKVIEINPQHTKAYFYRGLAYMSNGGYDRAISDFNKALELDPGLINANNMRAWCNMQKAQWDQSSQLYLYQLFESDSGLAEAYRGKGWSYVKQAQWELAAEPLFLKSKNNELIKIESDGTLIDNPSAESEISKLKAFGKPSVKVTPLSGQVGTKLSIYGWGFRANEDGMTVTWDNEIIVCNIRAELDGSLIIDGSKVPNVSSSYTGDTRESFYIPPTTKGRHILGVYGSSFTPKGTVNDTIIEVIPEISISARPDTRGMQIMVSGKGFDKQESVTVDINKTVIKGISDPTGNFEVDLVIPAEKGEKYSVLVNGDKGSSANATFVTAMAKPIFAEDAPDMSEVYCNRGFAHFKKAQWALAISDLDKAYAKNKELNRGSWNKEWAQGKQKQWDSIIADYSRVISTITKTTANQNISESGTMNYEIKQALDDYNKAAELAKTPDSIQKIKNAIKFIELWNKGV